MARFWDSRGFTDHKLTWVDIDWNSALGVFQKIQRPIARRLQCDDPRSVKKYLKTLRMMLDDAEKNRAVLLEANAAMPLSIADALLYEEIDKEITRCTQMAEKKCRKLFMGGVPYSPELVSHLNMINLWRLLIRKKKGSCSTMRTIIRLQNRCGVVERPFDLDITEIYQ